MSEARTGEFIRRAADWLRLAAAPTFAAMALYTSVSDSGPTAMLCSVAQHPSSLSGMVPMYLLLGAFHFPRSEAHTSELQSLMRISYAVLCLNNTKKITNP